MAEPTKSEIRRASAHIFELLLDWFPDIIQSVDEEGRIVYANRRASELLGYSREELIGMSIQTLYAPEVLADVQKGFMALQDRGNLAVADSLLCDKEGTRIPVEIRSFSVYDEEGNFVRTFSILRDIRDLKELQNSLIHASRLAAIGELAACVAHDISNPLAVIKLYHELLTVQADLPGAATPTPTGSLSDMLEGIGKSVDKIEKLVSHLRNFCRTSDSVAEPVNLCQVIGDALFMVTNKLAQGDVKVEQDLPGSCECYVRGQANQLEQVFMNLFSNACDAMQDVPEPRIRVVARPDVGEDASAIVVCTVKDCGVGIRPEHQDEIFRSFFTTKERGKGTGLGLAITRNIVRRHKGDIAVESAPDGGTTFTITLPAWALEDDAGAWQSVGLGEQ